MSDINEKLISNTSGFENIGRFYKHITKQKDLNPYDIAIYMILVEYSFGYTKDIKFEIKISMRKIAEKLNISVGKVSSTLKILQDKKLIERIKWQDFGPKQAYKYRVIFPKDFHIATKNKKEIKKDEMKSVIDMM